MPKFIPLSTFKSIYSAESDLLSEEGYAEFVEKLKNSNPEDFGIYQNELNEFITSVSDGSVILFYSWIERNASLVDLISNGIAKSSFFDDNGVLNHSLTSRFKRFFSPYLADILLNNTTDKLDQLVKQLSYTTLLDEDHVGTVERVLFQPISVDIDKLKQGYMACETEQELLRLIEPLSSQEVIECVNHLSKPSYALKLSYVDNLLLAMKSKACTPRLANWVLKTLEKLTLNDEHNYKISDLRRELRDGELRMRNTGKGRTPIQWRKVFSAMFFLTILASIAIVIIFKPFSEVHKPDEQEKTAFTQFSPDEIMRIDSLMQEMKGNNRDDEHFMDPSVTWSGGGTFVLRNPYVNQNMESIFNDMVKDVALHAQGFPDSCGQKENITQLNGVNDLSSRKASVKCMIRNDSEYDIVLYISDEKSNGAVFSMGIKQGNVEVFHMNVGDAITIVPGNHFQKFKRPSSVPTSDLPSSDYTHHFCTIDYNFEEAIHTSYEMVYLPSQKAKFMVTGDKGGYVELLDVNNVLELR